MSNKIMGLSMFSTTVHYEEPQKYKRVTYSWHENLNTALQRAIEGHINPGTMLTFSSLEIRED